MEQAKVEETKTEQVKTEPAKTEPVATTAITEPVKTEPAKTEPAAKTEPVKPVVPEKYDLKVPEGSKLSAKELETISAQAKEKGLSNEQAQLLVNTRHEAVKGYEAAELQRIKDSSSQWLEQLKADKEIGGERFNESIENAKRVVAKYTDPDFQTFLNTSGLGNHPMVVRAFAKIGKAFGEDHWKDGAASKPKQEKSAAEKLYDKT